MTERRPFSDYRPLRFGFNAVLGDDNGNRVNAVFDFEFGWKAVSDRGNLNELTFEPTWFEVEP